MVFLQDDFVDDLCRLWAIPMAMRLGGSFYSPRGLLTMVEDSLPWQPLGPGPNSICDKKFNLSCSSLRTVSLRPSVLESRYERT